MWNRPTFWHSLDSIKSRRNITEIFLNNRIYDLEVNIIYRDIETLYNIGKEYNKLIEYKTNIEVLLIQYINTLYLLRDLLSKTRSSIVLFNEWKPNVENIREDESDNFIKYCYTIINIIRNTITTTQNN